MISDLHCEEDDCIGDDWFQLNDLDQLFICVKDSLLTVCIRIISLVFHYHDQGCCHKKYYAPEEHKSYIENSMLKIMIRWIFIINYRDWYDGDGDSFQNFFNILVDFCHYQPMWSVLFVEARSLDTCYRNQQTLMLGTECFQESTLLFDPQNYMY